ncbi:hypothetical protein PM082_021815 [Marasmius tenuissimus]|nr:hypothetical protein PM082_021815 [Marasmius tenuissimus]
MQSGQDRLHQSRRLIDLLIDVSSVDPYIGSPWVSAPSGYPIRFGTTPPTHWMIN